MVASKHVKKQQINKDDNCSSITISCCGLASGHKGPHFFLVKAEKVEHDAFKNFDKKHKAPAKLAVIVTTNV